MINNFNCKNTQAIWRGEHVKQFPTDLQRVMRRKLRMLNNAVTLADLRIPPANRLESLKGSMKCFYSIRINDQWRIIFRFEAGQVYDVQIMDYH